MFTGDKFLDTVVLVSYTGFTTVLFVKLFTNELLIGIPDITEDGGEFDSKKLDCVTLEFPA